MSKSEKNLKPRRGYRCPSCHSDRLVYKVEQPCTYAFVNRGKHARLLCGVCFFQSRRFPVKGDVPEDWVPQSVKGS